MTRDPLFGAYECRLLMFLESDDYDCFRQVHLDGKQFKKISDAIFSEVHNDEKLKPGYQVGRVRLDPDRTVAHEVFEGMGSINEP